MEINLLYKETSPIAQILLAAGEALNAESSSLLGMSTGVLVETKLRGGQIKSFGRKDGEEAFYINTYRSQEYPVEVLLAPKMVGEITPLTLKRRGLLVRATAFLAAEEQIEIDTAWRGGSSFKLSQGLRLLRCSGQGRMLLCSFGSVHRIELKEADTFSIDSDHLLACSEEVEMRIRHLGGVRTSQILGKEILIELRGPGIVFLQTRSQDGFRDWLGA